MQIRQTFFTRINHESAHGYARSSIGRFHETVRLTTSYLYYCVLQIMNTTDDLPKCAFCKRKMEWRTFSSCPSSRRISHSVRIETRRARWTRSCGLCYRSPDSRRISTTRETTACLARWCCPTTTHALWYKISGPTWLFSTNVAAFHRHS